MTKLDPAEPVELPAILPCPFGKTPGSEHKPLRLLRMEAGGIFAQNRWIHCHCGAAGPTCTSDEEAIVAWNRAKR